MGRVIVGTDGSPESRRALAWAAETAHLRRQQLVVVYAIGPPENYNPYVSAYSPLTTVGVEHDLLEARRSADEAVVLRQRAEAMLHGLLEEVVPDDADMPIEVMVIESDRPARALLDTAEADDLLVVGNRGRGGFIGLLLGSVSQQCITHAPCPVAVIRSFEETSA
jgi:nucleotide-binding universal stress UspA family protein